MRKFSFSKLVRDKIVDSIIASGNNPKWRTLSTKEYIKELKKKLVEEASELMISKGKEAVYEIADVQELVDSLLVALNITKAELNKARSQKNKIKGSFKKRHYVGLVEVKDGAREIKYYLKYPHKYPEVK